MDTSKLETNTQTIERLTRERNSLAAKVEEMKDFIQAAIDDNDTSQLKHALADDCGRDYVPRAELEKEMSDLRASLYADFEALRVKNQVLENTLKECVEALTKAHWIVCRKSEAAIQDVESWEKALAKAQQALNEKESGR